MNLSHSYRAISCISLFSLSIFSLLGCGGNGSNPSGLPYWLSPGSRLTIIANSSEGRMKEGGNWIPIPPGPNNQFLASIVFIVTNAYIGRVVTDWAVDPRAVFEYHLEGSDSFMLDLSYVDKKDGGITVNMTQGKIDSGNQSGKGFGSIGKLEWKGRRDILMPDPDPEGRPITVNRDVVYTAKNCEMSHDLSDGNN